MNIAVRPAPPLLQNRIETALARPPARSWRLHLLRPGAFLSLALLLCPWLTGCGSPGAPQPPSLKLPAPPTDLNVTRSGDAVTLHWTMSRRATDRAPLKGDQRVVICRGADKSAACNPVGSLLLQPGLAASYLDALPASLCAGPPRLLTYTVLLENHGQRSAGPSNPAYTVAGAAPPALANLRAEASATGIVLRWDNRNSAPDTLARNADDAQPAQYLLRLRRTRVAVPGASPRDEPSAGVPQPAEQILEVPEASGALKPATLAMSWRLDHAIDQDAALNHTYRYTAERVARLTLAGHSIEASGPVAQPVTIAARDVFAPGVPQGLEAVADSEGHAIDLSWSPDTDRDLAGYHVYRRALDPVGSPRLPLSQVSGAGLLRDPAWRDRSARPKVRYAYSVSAVDTSGNESARCPEVQEVMEAAEP